MLAFPLLRISFTWVRLRRVAGGLCCVLSVILVKARRIQLAMPHCSFLPAGEHRKIGIPIRNTALAHFISMEPVEEMPWIRRFTLRTNFRNLPLKKIIYTLFGAFLLIFKHFNSFLIKTFVTIRSFEKLRPYIEVVKKFPV